MSEFCTESRVLKALVVGPILWEIHGRLDGLYVVDRVSNNCSCVVRHKNSDIGINQSSKKYANTFKIVLDVYYFRRSQEFPARDKGKHYKKV